MHAQYKIFIVTNGQHGDSDAPHRRQRHGAVFDRVFISEQMGCKKPDKLFYDKVFAEIGEDYRAQSIMIGDSLSSDMQGGRNAGIPTCLYGRTEPISPLCDYAVADLLELPGTAWRRCDEPVRAIRIKYSHFPDFRLQNAAEAGKINRYENCEIFALSACGGGLFLCRQIF